MSETKRFVTEDEINDLTAYHPPLNANIKESHETVRALVRDMMHEFNALLAESPQKTHLLRQLLPAVMMSANQVIAVHGINDDYWWDKYQPAGGSTLNTEEQD